MTFLFHNKKIEFLFTKKVLKNRLIASKPKEITRIAR